METHRSTCSNKHQMGNKKDDDVKVCVRWMHAYNYESARRSFAVSPTVCRLCHLWDESKWNNWNTTLHIMNLGTEWTCTSVWPLLFPLLAIMLAQLVYTWAIDSFDYTRRMHKAIGTNRDMLKSWVPNWIPLTANLISSISHSSSIQIEFLKVLHWN